MNYEQYLLNYLLDKYERSQAFVTGVFTQKIAIVVAKDKKLNMRLEDAEEKANFLEALFSLQQKALIDYSWVKFEKDNLVERIWLQTDNISTAYTYLGRKPKSVILQELQERMTRAYNKCLAENADGVITKFLAEELAKIEANKKGTAFFAQADNESQSLLKVLVRLNGAHFEVSERLLSVELYGDSKYFERHVKNRLLSVLRYMQRLEDAEEILTDEDLLAEYGLSRWPEIYEFLGNIKVCFEQGQQGEVTVDYGACAYGAYIDSLAVAHLSKISPHNITKVMFIENKANYEWYKLRKQVDELVIYHGGHYGLMKGKWFRYLYEAVKTQNPNALFYHWSDIDLGGFKIFVRLQKLIPELQPYQMDGIIYECFLDNNSKSISADYRTKLEKLLSRQEFSVFYDVISLILKTGKTLEQEQIIAREQ